MNILNEVDSVLYYDNIEKLWKKHKFSLIGAIIAIFACVAAFNVYNQEMLIMANHDSDILLKTIQQRNIDNYPQKLEKALTQLKTKTAKDAVKLESAKEFYKKNDVKNFESTLLELIKSRNDTIKAISVYMLAEFYLENDANKSIELIDSAKLRRNTFNYALIQDLKAMALISLGKKDEAKTIYTKLVQEATLSQELQTRINNKLELLK
ncbi:MAG: tetratricopeptide repeat protein [Proteobacteria bacterium]|nr:tetratricopeptide repeat protein [Pseudomonadota bacterium]